MTDTDKIVDLLDKVSINQSFYLPIVLLDRTAMINCLTNGLTCLTHVFTSNAPMNLQMTSSDPNVRSMATADLITQLKASQLNFFKQDEEIEKKIVKIFARLLQDKMLEMQNETVNG